MARKRFTPADRDTLTVPGLAVEWLDGSHWKAATVKTGEIVTTDGGYQHIIVVNAVTTRTISAGHIVEGGPGRIRLAR
jgi:hypothetical protein